MNPSRPTRTRTTVVPQIKIRTIVCPVYWTADSIILRILGDKMTEGTISLLFGAHHFIIHPAQIIIRWMKDHHRLPKFWQLICIFIHDYGLWGMQYLSGSKSGHWRRGALLAYRFFGSRGFEFCAGHTDESGLPRSELFFADKDSRMVGPLWLEKMLCRIEHYEKMGWPSSKIKGLMELSAINKAMGYPNEAHTTFLKEGRRNLLNELLPQHSDELEKLLDAD
jgi:hypothetical protein